MPELVEAVSRGVLAAGALPRRVPDRLAGRGVPQPDQHDVSQPDGDGHRGDDRRPADGRGGADRRLRQDGAGAADGRGVGQPAGDPARHRADDDRPAPRRSGSAPAPTAAASGRSTARAAIDADEIETVEGRLVGDRRHLRGDGHGAAPWPASPRRSACRCRAPPRSPRCTPTASSRRRRRGRAAVAPDRAADHAAARSSPRSRSRTRSAC